MISKIKQTNPKLALILFVIALAHRPILSSLRKIIRSISTPKQKHLNQYVGIQITLTEYFIGVGIPHFDHNDKIIDFSFKRQKRGTTSDDPQHTIKEIITYLDRGAYDFVGVSCFSGGNYERGKESSKHLTSKSVERVKWENYPILQNIKRSIKAKRYAFDTSVNANTLAQYKLGNYKIHSSLIYIDIGRVISIGIVSENRLLHSISNNHGCHIQVVRHQSQNTNFLGTCPYHSNCLQGFITTKSISSRCDIDILRLHTIRDDNPIWKLIGFYIAQLCTDLTLMLSPEVIVVTGDIMNRKEIFLAIQQEFQKLLNKYVDNEKLERSSLSSYITRPKIASSGIKGSMLLGQGNK